MSQATNEYQALVAILRSIQMLFAQRTFATAECYTIAKLSKMVLLNVCFRYYALTGLTLNFRFVATWTSSMICANMYVS